MSLLADQCRLSGVARYPVKSCRGQWLDRGTIEGCGLAGDRRWMVVGPDGEAVTARTVPRLVLVTPTLTAAGLRLGYPGADVIDVARPEPLGTASARQTVTVFGHPVPVSVAATEASAWFSEVLEQPVRLVFLDDPAARPIDPQRSRPDDRVSLADAYPMLLASESSLAALNAWVAAGPRAGDGPLPMTRFRPNLVVSGAPAWEEDRWRRVRIGSTTFRSVKACDRCVMTLVDPETATKTKEPLLSLAQHRQWDHKTWFAVNLIPDEAGAEVCVGDPVEVLESAPETAPQH